MILEKEIVAYSIDEAAKATNTGKTRLYAEIKSGRLKAHMFGKRTLISAESLKQWINQLPEYCSKAR
jgi:excisionase family DNA binding protein